MFTFAYGQGRGGCPLSPPYGQFDCKISGGFLRTPYATNTKMGNSTPFPTPSPLNSMYISSLPPQQVPQWDQASPLVSFPIPASDFPTPKPPRGMCTWWTLDLDTMSTLFYDPIKQFSYTLSLTACPAILRAPTLIRQALNAWATEPLGPNT